MAVCLWSQQTNIIKLDQLKRSVYFIVKNSQCDFNG
ncbi:hypothetical protein BWGOE4_32500 [Bacillus mycoides]|uniref:Uncharacterized protein n=2 Tax=Bacillus cereus group TaxID=86661 RepID=A0A1D3MNQ7_BACMY|nr:hypothetical protein IEM_00787 [Bacillus cereus BAG6O-2]EOP68824.1 hypothetical protein IIQ_02077 [Bacillus cereus VD118]OFD40855.1 hypothetical protein BWGOE2_32200 [Bacillus mycoides]OFD43668.1 hypothetical protein BWGOE1_32620 [Bacillus mycoides]OFD44215.1 hypothetical protein BWGOE3_32300 [Bacillus mycoides]